ncbi:asparagine synthase-related protein [Candidatus Omnitrophota bacterium]
MILLNDIYGWTTFLDQHIQICFKGYILIEGIAYCEQEGAKKLVSILQKCGEGGSCERISKAIRDINGEFGFIFEDSQNDLCIASVDWVQSYPLFYYCNGKDFGVSNDAHLIKERFGLNEKNKPSFIEFALAGYVSGPFTLFQGLHQLQAGEVALINKKNGTYYIELFRYYQFRDNDKISTKSKLLELLDEVTLTTFRNMILSLEGRPVVVPLSGGLDSRLVVCMLRYLNYENVICYSYGLKDNYEARIAREIADTVGYKWFQISLDQKGNRKKYLSKERIEYWKYADMLRTIPFFQDWVALWELKKGRKIPDDAVIINGQSGDFVQGGHIPLSFATDEDMSLDHIVDAIIKKHYSLWPNYLTPNNLKMIKERIYCSLGSARAETFTSQQAADVFELWEWQERQSKYVVNGQRVYEFYGYDWRLPLWNKLYMGFWAKVPIEYKLSRKLILDYLRKKNLYGLFDRDFSKKYNFPYSCMIKSINSVGMQFCKSIHKEQVWQNIEKRFFLYFKEIAQGLAVFPYRRVISNPYFRTVISFLTEEYMKDFYNMPLSSLEKM